MSSSSDAESGDADTGPTACALNEDCDTSEVCHPDGTCIYAYEVSVPSWTLGFGCSCDPGVTPPILADFEREHARIQMVITWWKECERPGDLAQRIQSAQATLMLAIAGVLVQMGSIDVAGAHDTLAQMDDVDAQQSAGALLINRVRETMIAREIAGPPYG